TRKAEDLKLTRHFDTFNVSVGLEHSYEDDYRSTGGFLETQIWTPDRNTTVTFGISGSQDDITSTNDPSLSEDRRNLGAMIGVTQVLTRKAIMQSNLTFKNEDGYLSDPYKLFDRRPQHRDALAWLTRLNYYFSSLDSALHSDYRYFRDSWGIIAHMLEFSYYQPIAEGWMIRPHLRFYSQSDAEFFSSTFPPETPEEETFTTDHRLGAFGGFSTGLKFM